jgi:D-alanyl-lipoteichoic acid acyltransferase DltB (MBOAT superfamily)
MFSTFLDYFTGIKMHEAKTKRHKTFWFCLSIIINIGFLGFFKYYNFFASSFAEALSHLGLKTNFWTLKVILPVGISFYTFHGLSYVIDIYKNRIRPEKNFIDYALFVSFFPLLVAGPIERATHLLPQIKAKRTFNYVQAVDGFRQILWGLFKKMVIADNCAEFVNTIFRNYADYNGSTLFLGGVFFALQIYCDFSGYSDIAIGTARLFGIDLLRNFAFPYFSRDIAEFWRRWHISLSSWFRDYLYIPLGGSKVGRGKKVRNIFIIFIVSGFWHGANWTFIVWGFLNAVYILPSILFKSNRNHLDIVAQGRLFPSLKELGSIILTFGLTTIAWIFFRSPSVSDAIRYISRIFSRSILRFPEGKAFLGKGASIYIMPFFILVFMVVEWLGREQQYAIANFGLKTSAIFRWSFYYGLILAIFYFSGVEHQFIYFQF